MIRLVTGAVIASILTGLLALHIARYHSLQRQVVSLQKEVSLQEDLVEMWKAANEGNVQTIAQLEEAEHRNRLLYEMAIERAKSVEQQIAELESTYEARLEEQIEDVRWSVGPDRCAIVDMPDAVRVRINPRSYHTVPDGN